MKETLKVLGMLIGKVIEREGDSKALVMLEYMDKNFASHRAGEISPQDYLRGSKEVWDNEEYHIND